MLLLFDIYIATSVTQPSSFLFFLLLRPYRRTEDTFMTTSTSVSNPLQKWCILAMLIIISSTPLASQGANTNSAPNRKSLSLCANTRRLCYHQIAFFKV